MADNPLNISDRIFSTADGLDDFLRHLDRINLHATTDAPDRVNADPENIEKGLARLVLTLIDLLRQLMERQAIRRMDAGSLTDEQIERMGQTFAKLEQRMKELTATFGLKPEDLNLDLGPLGRLL